MAKRNAKRAVAGAGSAAQEGSSEVLVETPEVVAPEVNAGEIPLLTSEPNFGVRDAVIPPLENKDEEKGKPAVSVSKPRTLVFLENFSHPAPAAVEYGKNHRHIPFGAVCAIVAKLVDEGKVAGDLQADHKVHVKMNLEILAQVVAAYKPRQKPAKQSPKNNQRRQSGSTGTRANPLARVISDLAHAIRTLDFFSDKNRGLNLSAEKSELEAINEQVVFESCDPSATSAKIKAIVTKMEKMTADHIARRVKTELQREADGLSSTVVQRLELEIRKIEEAVESGSMNGADARKALFAVWDKIKTAIGIARKVAEYGSPFPKTPRGEGSRSSRPGADRGPRNRNQR